MSNSTRKNVRKNRSESFSAACKRAAQEWDTKVNGVLEDPKRVLRREIRAVQVLVNKAGVALGRAVKEQGDVQAAFDKRAVYLKRKSELVKELYSL